MKKEVFMSYLDILKSVLKEESQAITRAALAVNEAQAQALVKLYERLLLTGGTLFICGVGKSGIIATKMASTFSSLGLASYFLHPVEALHGDLGRLSEKDAVIFISKSGSTEEIVKLLPYLPIGKENMVALVGDIKGSIALKCSLVFDVSVEKEACTNNLAPTTSSTLALAMGDAMAVVFESYKGISKEKFAKNHPGGLLGKSLTLKVKDLMLDMHSVALVSKDDNLQEAILKMTKFPTGLCCIVDQDQKLLGIIVEGDIRRALSKDPQALSKPLHQTMNQNPVVLSSQMLAYDALKTMETKERLISVAPVVDAGKLCGAIRLHDLLREGFSKA